MGKGNEEKKSLNNCSYHEKTCGREAVRRLRGENVQSKLCGDLLWKLCGDLSKLRGGLSKLCGDFLLSKLCGDLLLKLCGNLSLISLCKLSFLLIKPQKIVHIKDYSSIINAFNTKNAFSRRRRCIGDHQKSSQSNVEASCQFRCSRSIKSSFKLKFKLSLSPRIYLTSLISLLKRFSVKGRKTKCFVVSFHVDAVM